MAPYFTFLFLLPAPIAFFKQYQRNRSFLTTSSQIRTHKNASPLNHLNWIEFESYIGGYFKSQGYLVKQSFYQKSDGGIDALYSQFTAIEEKGERKAIASLRCNELLAEGKVTPK
ncbi:restriction endonuclease [Vibrio cyclitrophicus]